MVGNRLHKLGSIYERLTALLEKGVYKEYDQPIWYEIYKHHPPKYEPKFDRAAPDIKVRDIFYEEDVIRAKIHNVAKIRYFDLNSKKEMSQTKMWIKMCQEIMKAKGVSLDEAVKLMDISGVQSKRNATGKSENESDSNVVEILQ